MLTCDWLQFTAGLNNEIRVRILSIYRTLKDKIRVRNISIYRESETQSRVQSISEAQGWETSRQSSRQEAHKDIEK